MNGISAFQASRNAWIIWLKFDGLEGFNVRTVAVITAGILPRRDAMSVRTAIANQQ